MRRRRRRAVSSNCAGSLRCSARRATCTRARWRGCRPASASTSASVTTSASTCSLCTTRSSVWLTTRRSRCSARCCVPSSARRSLRSSTVAAAARRRQRRAPPCARRTRVRAGTRRRGGGGGGGAPRRAAADEAVRICFDALDAEAAADVLDEALAAAGTTRRCGAAPARRRDEPLRGGAAESSRSCLGRWFGARGEHRGASAQCAMRVARRRPGGACRRATAAPTTASGVMRIRQPRCAPAGHASGARRLELLGGSSCTAGASSGARWRRRLAGGAGRRGRGRGRGRGRAASRSTRGSRR